MKKLILFFTLLFVGFGANFDSLAQYSPSNNLNYIKLLKTPPTGSVEDSVMVFDGSDSFVKMRPSSELVTKATPTKSGVVKTNSLDTDPVVYTTTNVDTLINKKINLPTGFLQGLQLSINADPAKFDIAPGYYVVTDFTNLANPVVKIITYAGATGLTPAYLATANSTYVALDINGNVVSSASPFTNADRRTLAIIGNVVHSNNTTINVTNEIKAPIVASTNQVHDFMRAIGFLNEEGNIYLPNGANLQINKSVGKIFGMGINSADYLNPHQLSIPAQTALTFAYRLRGGTQYANTTSIDPNNWDNAGVLTSVPVGNRWTIQRINLFQSGLTRIQYGQTVYTSYNDAVTALPTQSFVTEQNIADNAVFRCYLIVKQGTTDLQAAVTAGTALFVPVDKFGNVIGNGSVALTYANIVAALGYTPENIGNKQNSLAIDGTGTKYPTVDAINSGVVKLTGNQAISGIKTFNEGVVLAGNTISFNRTLTGTGNAHAFEDNSIYQKDGSYASYDSKVNLQGNGIYNNHYNSYQDAGIVNTLGILDFKNSFISSSQILSGNINNSSGLLVEDIYGTGTVTNQYGVRVRNLTKGTNNYAIFTEGTTKSKFGGNVEATSVSVGTSNPSANLDINGTSRFNGGVTVTGNTSASSGFAKALYVNPTLVATANNDNLIGIDLAPLFNTGAFTGVANVALRVPTNTSITNSLNNGYNIVFYSNELKLNAPLSGGVLTFQTNYTTKARIFDNGNLILQNGGTFTDDGTNRLQVNGSTKTTALKLSNTPTTSAGTYDFLTRNTSTGVVEKVASNTIAAIASPAFTGTPTAPTAAPGTNTTQIATMEALQAADSGNVKLTGNQSFTGLKSTTNTSGTTNGIRLENNSTGSGAVDYALFLRNLGTGGSAGFIDVLEGGNGLYFESYVGRAIYVDVISPTGTGSGLTLNSNVGNTGDLLRFTNGKIDYQGTVTVPKMINTGVQEYADNASAIAAGLAIGTHYRTGDLLKIVH